MTIFKTFFAFIYLLWNPLREDSDFEKWQVTLHWFVKWMGFRSWRPNTVNACLGDDLSIIELCIHLCLLSLSVLNFRLCLHSGSYFPLSKDNFSHSLTFSYSFFSSAINFQKFCCLIVCFGYSVFLGSFPNLCVSRVLEYRQLLSSLLFPFLHSLHSDYCLWRTLECASSFSSSRNSPPCLQKTHCIFIYLIIKASSQP